MKKIIMLLCILANCTLAGICPPKGEKVIFIPLYEPIQPYEALWRAVCMVESSNNATAIGDKHLKEYSYGIVQIRKSRLKDYNNKVGTNYTINDLFNVEVSKKIFLYYCEGDYETVSRKWNGGNNGMKKRSTLKYYKKILKYL